MKSFTRATVNLEYEFYKKTIDEVGNDLIYLYFYFQGEPYMHPKFNELVKYAAQKKIYTVTSTNAHYLTERKARETVQSGLDRKLISEDDSNPSASSAGLLQKIRLRRRANQWPSFARSAPTRGALRDRHECRERDAMDEGDVN